MFVIAYKNITIAGAMILTPVKNKIATDTSGNEISIPSFVKYDGATSTFTVDNPGYLDVGTY